MSPNRSLTRMIPLAILAASVSSLTAADLAYNAGTVSPTASRARADFQAQNTRTSFASHVDGRIGRIYGRAFSHGLTTQQSVTSFVNQHADIWGVSPSELIAQGPFEDARHTQPIYYQSETDTYKFTATYFTQTKAGLPVFRSNLTLLTRNEESNPLVLASAQLFDLSAFNPDPAIARAMPDQGTLIKTAEAKYNGRAQVYSTQRVIYAGSDANPHAPIVADDTIVDVDGYKKFRIITDAATGAVIFDEPLTHTIDITGNAAALASEGIASDNCEAEVSQPLPYLNVGVQGGNSSFTDANGDFTIPNGGSANVTVDAGLDGQWFDVFNFLGSETSASSSGSPSSPINLLFNALNNSEQVRAEVNAYVEANRVRDFAISANPAYPTLNNGNFPVTVNRTDGFCPGNAWYDSVEQSINFCLSGSSNPNTAWSSVIHHEYGHHLVNAGGSGQGQYGEGMGDVMSTIILDDPRLGQGFFGSCNGSLRNADNTMQYPCSGAIHTCGQLISGCVWSTRQILVATEPASYQQILTNLAVNAILVHNGDTITPQITIDWLTLDDDDSDITNGTPHYNEIDTGFSAHNMDAPELTLVDISPVGLPDFVDPNGSTTIVADITNVSGTLDPSTPTLMVDTGSGFSPVPMSNDGGGQFSANVPSSDCGSQVSYYITAETTSGATQTAPAGAPSASFSAISSSGSPSIAFDDNGQTNMGWTTSGTATDGQWNRGTPVGGGDRADPPSDADGSGACYLTDNVDGNSDVDGGFTTLTSPIMDATGQSVISYARWFNNAGNTAVDDTFEVEISDDAGSSWTTLETLGVNHPESNGGWFFTQHALDGIAGFTPNSQFRIRFTAEDIGSGSIVEAGVDAVQLLILDCSSCPADLNGDGNLDFFDVSAFLAAFNNGDASADFNGDGNFDFFDVSAFLGAFSAGCP